MTRLLDQLWRPVDIASLVAFRVAFGALALCAVLRHVAYGWVDQFFITPHVFFPYPGLAWIVPLPAAGMYALYAGLALCALGILTGAWTRLCAALFCIGFTYAHLIDRTNYLNHYYLVSILSGLLAVLPSGGALSIDAWRCADRRRVSAPAWAVFLLRFQLAVVYIFGAVAKVNADWLLHAEPLRIWLGANVDLPLLGPWLERTWVAYAFSYAGLLFDASIVPLLLWRRTRPLAYGAVLAFHLLTAALFPIGMFPWLMIALTPIFFAPAWPRRVLGWIGRDVVPAGRARASQPRARWAVATALALYALVQLLIPLRHFAYDGDLYWTESGFRWSWQIMVMEKFGRAVFTVTDPVTGGSRTVRPLEELTPLQYRMMATQPDMLLSYAQRLRDRYAAMGDAVQVFGDVTVTLNGRPAAPLVDPAVDLAALPDSAAPSAWLLPHPDAQRQVAVR
ncbi:MAG: HTTM domain-containing protein [Deltaproteobacteria bacterium]|nr:HTTM domain-containing protein [Deltaproteobacteria bacterium]